MDWTARHPGRVCGIAVIETFLRPLRWAEMPPQGAELFQKFRSPEGERMILQENMVWWISNRRPGRRRSSRGSPRPTWWRGWWRIAFVLNDVFELGSAEAAWILDITPAAYRKRLERAKKRLGNFLNSSCGLANPKALCRSAGPHRCHRGSAGFGPFPAAGRTSRLSGGAFPRAERSPKGGGWMPRVKSMTSTAVGCRRTRTKSSPVGPPGK